MKNRDTVAAEEGRKRPAGCRSLVRGLFLIALVVTIAILPAVVFGRSPPDWVPVPLRNWAFDVRLVLSPPAKKALSFVHGSFRDDTVYIDDDGQDVTFQSDGLTIAGTLYRPDTTAGKRPAILLLHGSTPEGRKLGLYRILGKELALRGYFVLSMDQRGYGDSDDPPDQATPTVSDSIGDVKSGISYLSSLEMVDAERLYILGHSGGGSVAITAGIEDSRILAIAAMGPSRRVQERAGDQTDSEWAYFQRRDMRYMKVSLPPSVEILLERRNSLPLENHLEYFMQDGHKPLLLIDGALESEADQRFLREICEAITEPKECITIDADHYANTANLGPVVVYDQRAIKQVVDEIDSWLLSSFPAG